jgi:FkbM family methyltransferase
VVTDRDGDERTFYHTNNSQSSSVLEFGTVASEHPQIFIDHSFQVTTSRIDTLIDKYNIPISTVNTLNLDIQGVEYEAL